MTVSGSLQTGSLFLKILLRMSGSGGFSLSEWGRLLVSDAFLYGNGQI